MEKHESKGELPLHNETPATPSKGFCAGFEESFGHSGFYQFVIPDLQN